jgi:mannosylglycerate hydrolase
MPSKRKIYLVTYTHWDREFRWEFERTRMRLVDCLDHLIELMEQKKAYRSFLLDGQATLLDDYLEIRPENRGRIRALAQANRLELGPWYTLPDCAAVQGETLIRNLQAGFRTALQFGPVLKCGYNVFSFGQIAQLPQIYDGFGIDTILFYKYMDPKRTRFSEFVWEAPDGTQALASRLGREARWNFFFAGHIPIVYNRDPWHKDWQYRWGDFGKVFHTAGPEDYGWFYDILGPETSFHPENVKDGLERALKTVEGTAAPECVLLFEGTDFTEPHPLTTELIAEIRKQFGREIELVHGRLSGYLADLQKALAPRRDELDVVKGPMRDGPVGAVHSDVFSIHPEIMKLHGRVETALLNRAEPLGVFSWLNGADRYPTTYLDKIWKLLFQSHVHDSVHGLGPRTLGAGVMSRLEQAEVIVKGLERRGLQNITQEINTSGVTETEFFVAVHNFSASERSEVVEAWLDLPREARVDHLVIEDENGCPMADQQMEKFETRAGVYHPHSRNMPYYCTRIHLWFLAECVPAMGYKTFRIKAVAKAEYPYPHEDWEPPRIYADDLLRDARTAENEFLRVRVNGDGTLELTHKATGETYSGLNYFLDSGEIGNMWMSKEPHNNRILDTRGMVASVGCRTHGPLAVVFDIRLDWQLPREFDRSRQARSETEVAFPVSVAVVLRKNCPYLEVITTIQNTARDHYLKACFPTDSSATRTWGEGSFTVDEFPINPGCMGVMRGPALARHPAQMWFDVSDGKRGLAVLTEAPCDYEVLEHDPRVTAAMGLVRSVPVRIPCDNRLWMEYPGDESAQSLRSFAYRYALLPHAGDWNQAGLHQAALALRNPLQPCQFGRQQGKLPLSHSFLSLDGKALVLSTIKKAADRDSVIVRFYNPSNNDTKASLRVGFSVSKAWLVNLNEERVRSLKVTKSGIQIPVGHGKIVSVEMVK